MLIQLDWHIKLISPSSYLLSLYTKNNIKTNSFSWLQGKVRLYTHLLKIGWIDKCLNFPDPFVESNESFSSFFLFLKWPDSHNRKQSIDLAIISL